LTVSGSEIATKSSFEDAFNGAVVIEQLSHSQMSVVESNMVVGQDKRIGWFWNTLKESASIYRNMFITSVFINLLTLSLPLFAMMAFDKSTFGTNYMTWALAIGATICYLYIVALRLIRSHFLDIARVKADPEASQFFSHEVMSALFDLPFVVLALTLMAYIGGFFVVFPLVSLILIVCYIFVFGSTKPAKQTVALLQLLFGLNAIIILASGISMIQSNSLSTGTLTAIMILLVYTITIAKQIPLLAKSYALVKTAYENSERILRLSVEYGRNGAKLEPSTKLILWTVFSMLVAFIAWTGFVDIDEKVCATGTVLPSAQVYKIQSFDGGTLEKLLVKEGDRVDINQTLAKLDTSSSESKATENRIKLFVLMAKAGRLNAENENKAFVPAPELVKGIPFNVKREQLLYLKDVQLYLASLESAKTQLKLAGADEAKIKEANAKLTQIRTVFKTNITKELSVLNAEIEKLKITQKSLDEKVTHCTISSPIKATVKKIYHEGAGNAVLPNGDILDLEPIHDSVFVSAKIKGSDIYFIKPGQDVGVKIGSQSLKGKVEFVSVETAKTNKNEKFCTVKIKANKADEKSKPNGEISIEIATGKQSILSHIIRPIFKK
jgi:membrane fusion protein, adhesin transport system